MPVGRRPRVLIVDDDPVFTLLASETLEQGGFGVSVAATTQEALTSITSEMPDLAMLDVELRGSNGFDLCLALRAAAGGADLPIIMVTGHEDTSSIARAYEVGATDFINKPVLWGTLPHRVEFLLRARNTIRALRTSEQKNLALLQALPDDISIVGKDGKVLEHFTGGDREASGNSMGRRLEELFPSHIALAARTAMHTLSGGTDCAPFDFEVGEGEERRSFEGRLRPQPDGTFLVITRDVTARRRADAQIEHLAFYDSLTGLPNRQLFVREMDRAFRAGDGGVQGMALLYLDLDRFKRINDNLGRFVGDELLKSVAQRLRQSIRALPSGQAQLARLGGDEFVVLLPGVGDDRDAVSIAERIEKALAQPFECAGHRFVVTPSIGIALYPRDATDAEDLLGKADIAMYQAKGQGRNTHAFYGESMALRSLGRLEMENDLRRAIEAGNFQLYYQPKMDINTSEIVGVEALLRWQHPERGWVAPDVFIPIAEETGMIVPLGDWVIREAVRQLKAWALVGLGHITVAVNVSVQQFASDDFVDTVLRTLFQHGIKPQQFELEITESLLMQNLQATAAALGRLRAAGIELSIDDFGTGYSSLGYLRQLPVDALKIDRSFVKDLRAASDDGAICAAIIAMARELKLKVIAEGVENTEQLEFLRKQGCDQAQGYLISKPVCATDIENLLRRVPCVARVAQASVRD